MAEENDTLLKIAEDMLVELQEIIAKYPIIGLNNKIARFSERIMRAKKHQIKKATVKEVVKIHVQAEGPVDIDSIRDYVLLQQTEFCPEDFIRDGEFDMILDSQITVCLNELIRENEILVQVSVCGDKHACDIVFTGA